MGYGPWGRRESDTTEQLSTAHSHSMFYFLKTILMFSVVVVSFLLSYQQCTRVLTLLFLTNTYSVFSFLF